MASTTLNPHATYEQILNSEEPWSRESQKLMDALIKWLETGGEKPKFGADEWVRFVVSVPHTKKATHARFARLVSLLK